MDFPYTIVFDEFDGKLTVKIQRNFVLKLKDCRRKNNSEPIVMLTKDSGNFFS